MGISIFLAKVLGLYLVIASIWMLVRYRNFESVVREMETNPVYVMTTGFMALIFGTLIIMSHNIWAAHWMVLITILGWLVLIKGLIRLFVPEVSKRIIAGWFRHRYVVIITAIITLLVGLFLLYHGFAGHMIFKM